MSSKPYILAVDQGTTGARAVLYRATAGVPVGMKSLPVRQYYPKPGWVEHDPEEILESVRAVMREVPADGGPVRPDPGRRKRAVDP